MRKGLIGGKNEETQVDTGTVEKVSCERASSSAAEQEKRKRVRTAVGQARCCCQRWNHAH
jgi:hypothetical protein